MLILNCLPPSPVNMPSAGLSILSSYLQKNGIKTETIYWNLLLHKAVERDLGLPGGSVFLLLLYLLGRLRDCPERQCTGYIEKAFPGSYNSTEKIDEACDFLVGYMRTSIERLAAENADEGPLYFGFQVKHDQWASAMCFSSLVKQVSNSLPPDCRKIMVIAGGFASRESAEAYRSIDPDTDFCFWGEAEESLLAFIEGCGSSEAVINPRRPADKDFRERIFPDYSGYFRTVRATGIPDYSEIQLPLEGIRGCHWNRCKFCIATRGLKYSIRSPESMAREISIQNRLYKTGHFYLTDDDTTGGSGERIESLCRNLGPLHRKSGGEIHYTAWINPAGFRLEHFKGLQEAGFTCLKTGHESNCDSLLDKMDKRSRFADNILFLKAANIYGIEHQGGIPIIMGIPGESEEDLFDSMDNLRFLRFFLNDNTRHGYNRFDLGAGSRFYREMGDEEKSNYNLNILGKLLPEGLLRGKDNYFLQYKRNNLVNSALWDDFKKKEREIRDASFSYSFTPDECGKLVFREYCGDRQMTAEIRLSGKEVLILRKAEDRVIGLKEICDSADDDEGRRMLQDMSYKLKKHGLLYISKDETQCVSVVMLPALRGS